MSGKGDSDGSDLDSTVRESNENNSTEMEAVVENLKLQMEQLMQDLEAERKERQRLAGLLEQNPPSTTEPANHHQPAVDSQTALGTSNSPAYQTSQHQHQTNHFQVANENNFSPNVASFSSSRQNMSVPAPSALNPHSLPFASPTYTTQSSNITRKMIDLPAFSGKPEEWPSFYMAYKESTDNIGYSNWENHLRLTKALTGEAKESVSALLIHPNNVNMVITELQRQFGQNEQLLRSQLEQAKNLQAIPEHRLDMLIPFATKVRNLAAFLESMDSLPHLANPNLIEELAKKLPTSRIVDWGMFAITVKPYVTVRHFSDWVSNLAHVVSLVNIKTPTTESAGTTKKFNKTKNLFHVSEAPKKEYKCPHCKRNHLLADCIEFRKLSVPDRWTTVKNNRLCFSCLRFGHATFACRSKKHCATSGCKRSHNSLLHDATLDNTENSTDGRHNQPQQHVLMNRPEAIKNEPEVLFKILPVVLYGSNGSSMNTFALIDEGSSITLVDNSVLEKLNLKGKPEQLSLQWFGSNKSTEESQVIDLQISSSIPNSQKYHLNNVHSVNNIDLPVQSLSMSKLCSKYQAVKKLPVIQYENAKPLLLIGLDNGYLGAPTNSSFKSVNNEPIAVKTKLGWLVYGPCDFSQPRLEHHISLHICTPIKTSCNGDDQRFDDIINNFFTAESFGVRPSSINIESNSDKKAKELLHTTTMKIGNRYQTGLLWKSPDIILPPSFEMAKNRLLSMERKMNLDIQFGERYKEMVNAFIEKGYARKLSSNEANVSSHRTWYLPHFATTNPNKPGKYRLVFDAAAKSRGVSLNDNLLKGPDMYNSLVKVLLNFRSKGVGVCADISEMFSQVRIQPSDVHSQRFLWRDGNSSRPIDIYILESMTFGVTCSPASAHHVKNSNAMSFKDKYPQAVHSILEHHYVDDYVDSFDNIEDAKRVSSEVTAIHAAAGFKLRGFISNKSDVSKFLNGCDMDTGSSSQVKPMNLEESTTEKILGLIWDTEDDSFKFTLKFTKVKPEVIDGTRTPSKRELLSIIMSVTVKNWAVKNYTKNL